MPSVEGPLRHKHFSIWGIWGRLGYPPPVSQLCPIRGVSQSEPGGWSSLAPPPGTPLPGTGFMTAFLERRPHKTRPPRGGGGGLGGVPPPGTSVPRRVDSDRESAATPPLPLLYTPGIKPESSAAPDTLDYSPLPTSHTPPPTSCQACGMSIMPCSPSSAYFTRRITGQRYLQGCQMSLQPLQLS